MACKTDVEQLKRTHGRRLLKMPGVSGVGIERGPRADDYVLVVHVSDDDENDTRRRDAGSRAGVGANREERTVQEAVGAVKRYSVFAVLRIRLPFATAGVAMDISSSEFFPRTLNSGPAWITKVSPSSLRAKIRPL